MPNMHYLPTMRSHEKMTSPLSIIQDCEASCEHMITMLLGYQDVHARTMQIQFLRDCATICTTTAAFCARQSMFAKSMANFCAHICEVCGNECLKFPDQESQRCGRICLNCAQECRAFAMAA